MYTTTYHDAYDVLWTHGATVTYTDRNGAEICQTHATAKPLRTFIPTLLLSRLYSLLNSTLVLIIIFNTSRGKVLGQGTATLHLRDTRTEGRTTKLGLLHGAFV